MYLKKNTKIYYQYFIQYKKCIACKINNIVIRKLIKKIEYFNLNKDEYTF